ncbi:MAG TPA: hypothetical protein VKY74_22410, partial [Chloroflexia bacterium]|nr:hypothetical protein [Chloroflexia bacterium]
QVYALDVSGCSQLTGWPAGGIAGLGRLTARNCPGLRSLPDGLGKLWQLDVSGCPGLTALPEGLQSAWIDVADTPITQLPASLQPARLRWHGVEVEARVVFHPETITADQVLRSANSETRRVLMERMGYEAFLAQVQAEVLAQDRDAGGPRQLVRVRIPDDEPLVCLAVRCPSTGRQYMLRVPPALRTCHQAAAWIAGFDNADQYQPIMET